MIRRSTPGKIAENLYCLGPEGMPTYLLDGRTPSLFDAGISILGEHYVSEIRKILGSRPLDYLFLSHVHFDHCGSAGFLKHAYPDLTICASSVSAEIIAKPSALELIGKLNTMPGMTADQKFKIFSVDRVMREGDTVDLHENGFLQAFSTPGHTRDMMSYYLPQIGTLLPSEAAGVPASNGQIYAEFLVDYNSYLDSLMRLADLKFDRILCGHWSYFDGEDAAGYFESAITQAVNFKNKIVTLLAENQNNLEVVGRIIKAEEYEPIPEPKMMEQAYDLNLEAKIKTVARLQGVEPGKAKQSDPTSN
ncbi:MAG: MBL fold metallo-hydrolase [SAR324 cluster bacterium]|nr:MBL fold metallo-hydrolase [SAR324 cluster bacterium]